VVLFQILLDGAETHVMQGRPGRLLQSTGGEANRIFLEPALSSMHTMCPNRVSRFCKNTARKVLNLRVT